VSIIGTNRKNEKINPCFHLVFPSPITYCAHRFRSNVPRVLDLQPASVSTPVCQMLTRSHFFPWTFLFLKTHVFTFACYLLWSSWTTS
jgi:hypothetical protein